MHNDRFFFARKILFVSILIASIFAIIYLFKFKSASTNYSTDFTNSQLKIEIGTDLNDLQPIIDNLPKNLPEQILSTIIQRSPNWDGNFLNLETNRGVNVNTIKITFKDISLIPLEQRARLVEKVNSNQKIVRGFQSNYIDKSIEYDIYIDQELINSKEQQRNNDLVRESVSKLLYLSTRTNLTNHIDEYYQLKLLFDQISEAKRYQIVEKLLSMVVLKAHAQSCGSYTCGLYVQNCECKKGNDVYPEICTAPNADCGPFGGGYTCQCTTPCVPAEGQCADCGTGQCGVQGGQCQQPVCVGQSCLVDPNSCSNDPGGGDPTPTPTPIPTPSGAPPPEEPPPPPGCSGNWWQCSGNSCFSAPDGQGVCGQCPGSCGNPKGKAAFFFFEDINNDGVWNYGSEPRISATAACAQGDDSIHVDGIELNMTDSNGGVATLSQICDLGLEYTGNTCTFGGEWGWDDMWGVMDSCLMPPITCGVDDTLQGRACGQNPAYCNEYSSGYLREGPIYMVTKPVGGYAMWFTLPDDWVARNGYSFGTSISTEGTGRVACMAGVTGIPIRREEDIIETPINKACIVAAEANGSSVSITASGQSSSTVYEPTRLIIAKSDFSAMPNVPSGTVRSTYGSNNYYIYQTDPILINSSLEFGFNGWGSNTAIDLFGRQTHPQPDPVLGSYYMRVSKDNSGGDAFVFSDFMQTGQDLTGKSFNVSFWAKSPSSVQISGIALQRAPHNGDYADTLANLQPISTTTQWQKFTQTVTFPTPSNENTSNTMRLILRAPSNPSFFVEYDGFSITRAVDNTFNCNTANSVNCNDDVTITDLEPGIYRAFCDLPTDNPERCSGNPNCMVNGGTEQCPGINSCSENDHTTFEITCSPMCGQPGCGNTDAGTPGNITAASVIPSDAGNNPNYGLQVNLTSGENMVEMIHQTSRLTFEWPRVNDTYTDQYQVLVWDRGASLTRDEALAEAENAYPNPAANSQLLVVDQKAVGPISAHHIPLAEHSYKLSIAIRAVNTTCDPYAAGTKYGAWLERQFDLKADMTGNFYVWDDTVGQCTVATQIPDSVSATISNLSVPSGGAGSVTTEGSFINNRMSYLIENVPYIRGIGPGQWGDNNITLSLESTNPEETLVCSRLCGSWDGGADCTHINKSSPTNPTADYNFYLSTFDMSNGPWWQIINGIAYSGGAMNSQVPDTCDSDPNCNSYVSTRRSQNPSDTNSAGPLLTGSNQIIAGESGNFWAVNGASNSQPHALSQDFGDINDRPEDYAYFDSKISFSGGGIAEDVVNEISDLIIGGDQQDDTYINKKSGNLTISPSSTMVVGSNQKIIILVDGDLTIEDDNIGNGRVLTVNPGGYISFIVRGDIIIDQSVGHNIDESNYSITTPNISGVFIADNIIVDSDDDENTRDKKFVGEGTFVGWSGIELKRSFEDNGLGMTMHNITPAEVFIFRPDFVENMPAAQEAPVLLWQEIN